MQDTLSSTPLLHLEHLSKEFPGVKALDDVRFDIDKGEIIALLGGNGAGKSTIIKCITGIYTCDTGVIELDGENIKNLSAKQIQSKGISTVHQEVNLIQTLSVAENIYLGRQPIKRGCIDWKKMNDEASNLLERMDIHIDVSKNLSEYSIAIQQMIAIARGIDMSAKLLILDEPTASLDDHEVGLLFKLMRQLKEQGISIIFVTHFLDQVYEICDRITVLRNGKYVATKPVKDLPQEELIHLMLGKNIKAPSATTKKLHKVTQNQSPYLSAIDLGKKGTINPFNLELYQGQSLGLAGLLGSGRTEIARLLFGVDKYDQGEMLINGKKVDFNSPNKAIRAGMAFCPEDRKIEGIIGELSVLENIILALQAKKGWAKALNKTTQKEIAEKFIKSLNIATPDMYKPVKDLSGGNQQKVILARWLASEPHLLILDEPTRGIDVGAKQEIMQIIDELCEEGMALLVISSELEEVVEMSDHVVVLKDKHKIAELKAADINAKKIMATIAKGGDK